ncbi:MAG: MOSC domain-containing protein [Hydrotalea sp.]|nr:MOSC domain-containing protein [Hydrotalea sp.]
MAANIISLHQYPLQGAQGQAVAAMRLTARTAPPLDRVFGIVEKIRRLTTDGEQVIHKLRGDRELLTLRADYDPASKTLSLHDQNKKLLASARLPKDDQVIADAIAKFLGYSGANHPLSMGYKSDPSLFGGFIHDRAIIAGAYKKTAISIINLASLRELAARAGVDNNGDEGGDAGEDAGEDEGGGETAIDPKRFRANVYIDGLAPFAELSWVGQTITCGAVALRVVERTARCAITEVNPGTGQRDFPTLTHLKNHYHHLDMGIYAEIITDGDIAVGDELSLSA